MPAVPAWQRSHLADQGSASWQPSARRPALEAPLLCSASSPVRSRQGWLISNASSRMLLPQTSSNPCPSCAQAPPLTSTAPPARPAAATDLLGRVPVHCCPPTGAPTFDRRNLQDAAQRGSPANPLKEVGGKAANSGFHFDRRTREELAGASSPLPRLPPIPPPPPRPLSRRWPALCSPPVLNPFVPLSPPACPPACLAAPQVPDAERGVCGPPGHGRCAPRAAGRTHCPGACSARVNPRRSSLARLAQPPKLIASVQRTPCPCRDGACACCMRRPRCS